MTSEQSVPKLPAGVKLSDVFHLAADKYLARSSISFRNDNYKWRYSCGAIQEALVDIFGDHILAAKFQLKFINPGLKNLGLNPGSTTAFMSLGCTGSVGFKVAPKAQAARYSWLKFCAMLAEEQEAAGASWN